MTRQISFLYLLLLYTSACISQSANFNNVVNNYIKQATSSGYINLDSGGGRMNREFGLEFDINNFNPGEYIIAVLIDDCTQCQVEIFIKDLESNKSIIEKPSMIYADNIGLTTYSFKQTIYGKGNIIAGITSTAYRHGYTMLFKKK